MRASTIRTWLRHVRQRLEQAALIDPAVIQLFAAKTLPCLKMIVGPAGPAREIVDVAALVVDSGLFLVHLREEQANARLYAALLLAAERRDSDAAYEAAAAIAIETQTDPHLWVGVAGLLVQVHELLARLEPSETPPARSVPADGEPPFSAN